MMKEDYRSEGGRQTSDLGLNAATIFRDVVCYVLSESLGRGRDVAKLRLYKAPASRSENNVDIQ